MAHFAQLNENNIVTRVIVVHNNELKLDDGSESEEQGIKFCQSIFGENTIWKQTSYNGNFRKNYAGQGYVYDYDRDAFIPPKPYDSWILDGFSCVWNPPIPYPTDGNDYYWDEELINWVNAN